MNKSYLKQILTYFSKIYHLGEKINTLKDKRAKSSVKISTVTFVVLFGFMLQIRSFNRLEHCCCLGKPKYHVLIPLGVF
jgi:hypothetical protein